MHSPTVIVYTKTVLKSCYHYDPKQRLSLKLRANINSIYLFITQVKSSIKFNKLTSNTDI